MLFTYQPVPHNMEKMQEFIDFIFHKVWCKAPTAEYGMHLFEPNEALHTIMDELYRRDLADSLQDGAGKWFYCSVNEIYIEFGKLDTKAINEYHRYFQDNNTIEALCAGDTDHRPVRYFDLSPEMSTLNERLKAFYKNLYSSGFWVLAFVKEAIGTDLASYYNDFVRTNNQGVCPFCGIQPIDNELDPTREAFDHYLPKSKYPFNSVNLKNLCPICSKCNTGNKADKDPLHDQQQNRRRAFYPFSTASPDIDVSITLLDKNWEQPTSDKLDLSLHSGTSQDMVETWDDLFSVHQRYLARCCSTQGAEYWINQVLRESENYEKSAQEVLQAQISWSEDSPWIEANFLKAALLKGCERAGLFTDQPNNVAD